MATPNTCSVLQHILTVSDSIFDVLRVVRLGCRILSHHIILSLAPVFQTLYFLLPKQDRGDYNASQPGLLVPSMQYYTLDICVLLPLIIGLLKPTLGSREVRIAGHPISVLCITYGCTIYISEDLTPRYTFRIKQCDRLLRDVGIWLQFGFRL